MKRLQFAVLILTILFTNSCGHNKITFGSKNNYQPQEQVQENHHTSFDYSATHEKLDVVEEQQPTVKEKRTLEQFVEKQIDEHLAPKEASKMHTLMNQFTESESDQAQCKKGSNSRAANSDNTNVTLFVVIGILFLVLGIVFGLVAAQSIDDSDNSSTAEGCLTSLILGALALIGAIVFGIMGVVFLVIGIVAFTGARSSASNNN